MADASIIEETLARIAMYGVRATIIHTHDGVPIRSTLQSSQNGTNTEQNTNLTPKIANISARLFHAATAAARAAGSIRHLEGNDTNREKEKERRHHHGQTVDSIRIRTSANGVTSEVIIMNGESRSTNARNSHPVSSDDPPILVTVIQDCS